MFLQYSSIAQSVEHAAVNRAVVGSSPTRGVWLLGQVVKTPPFHGGNMGSNPVGVMRGAVPSTRGPEWTHHWCNCCRANGIAGKRNADGINAEGI